MVRGLVCAAPSTEPVLEGAMANYQAWLALKSAADTEAQAKTDAQTQAPVESEPARADSNESAELEKGASSLKLAKLLQSGERVESPEGSSSRPRQRMAW